MKNLLTIATLTLLAFNVSAQVNCKKDGRFYYPNDAKSKSIAKMLGVKTCNGKRFKKVLAQLGETSNVKASTKHLSIEEVVAQLKRK